MASAASGLGVITANRSMEYLKLKALGYSNRLSAYYGTASTYVVHLSKGRPALTSANARNWFYFHDIGSADDHVGVFPGEFRSLLATYLCMNAALLGGLLAAIVLNAQTSAEYIGGTAGQIESGTPG